jgi:hypothetical protein
MTETQLNPQPLPPAKVDLGNLTEAVTTSVRNALEARAATRSTPPVFRNPRITVGIIIEPSAQASEASAGYLSIDRSTTANMSLFDHCRVAEITGNALRLIALDEVWTHHQDIVAQTPSRDGDDVKSLHELTKEMDTLLSRLEGESKWLQDLAARQGARELDLVGIPLADEQKHKAQEIVRQQGGLVAALKASAQAIVRQFPIEREELAKKMRELDNGLHPPGDMSAQARCIIGFVCLFSEAGPVVAAGVILIATNC